MTLKLSRLSGKRVTDSEAKIEADNTSSRSDNRHCRCHYGRFQRMDDPYCQ